VGWIGDASAVSCGDCLERERNGCFQDASLLVYHLHPFVSCGTYGKITIFLFIFYIDINII
jgi:hypothetical protein